MLVIIPHVVALVLTLVAWPASRLEPRDVPVGVVGAPAAATAIERQLAARDGAFETHRYADEAAVANGRPELGSSPRTSTAAASSSGLGSGRRAVDTIRAAPSSSSGRSTNSAPA